MVHASSIHHQVLKFLEDESRRDPAKFKGQFFKEFGHFLKEGICQVPPTTYLPRMRGGRRCAVCWLLRVRRTVVPWLAGCCLLQDFENQSRIAKLMYFESSRMEPGELTSFDE